jgi:hypothetical protein
MPDESCVHLDAVESVTHLAATAKHRLDQLRHALTVSGPSGSVSMPLHVFVSEARLVGSDLAFAAAVLIGLERTLAVGAWAGTGWNP